VGYVNIPPNLKDRFDSIYDRLRKLETAQRFTFPAVTTDPSEPRIGDAWLNTTTNQAKIIDAAGNTRIITWT
jgi:hypothetical protein